MTTSRAQQAIVDRERRQAARDYHRALDDAIHEAEGIADLIPPDDLLKAADRLTATSMAALEALTDGDPRAAHGHAVELAGVAATLTARKDT